eukprot:TRINITY_DN2181_c0_g1_i1.p1 TRINITY_DN2181_c0_g1~~TRINITY_DN2181_c0_g1_i1.p1  ORF type:complete len:207 (-),score=42.59 TRINITY_DN2181_c0_g1_i1:53-673(-)
MSKVDVKVVLLGMADVGKTCLVERFLNGTWNQNTTATVGAAFGAKKIMIPSSTMPITLGIWDTAGAERYESMSRIYYRSARAACVCFDLSSKDSFKKVKFWVDELLQNEEQCAIYLVGTKFDLVTDDGEPRGVEASEVAEYAKNINAVGVFETSAKKGTMINELFQTIATHWYENERKNTPVVKVPATNLNNNGNRTNGPDEKCPC